MPAARAQRGVVLFIALIVLVAMTLAGVAIMRSVDTGNLIAGNVAFKQGTLQGGDFGANKAVEWLEANAFTGKLDNDSPDDGYFSQGNEPDNWSDDANWADAKTAGTDKVGNTVQYKIHRLCLNSGASQNNNCAKIQPTSSEAGNTTGYGTSKPPEPTPMVLYRVTARVIGPRDTTSIIQFNIALQQ